jgi:hypothetical protein
VTLPSRKSVTVAVVPEAAGQGKNSDPPLVTFLKNAAIVLGALGVLAYGLLQIAYVQFYSEFHVTPEQAGIDKSELLSAALVGPAILFAFFCLFSFLIVFVTILVTWVRERKDPGRPALWSRDGLRDAVDLGKARFRSALIWSAVIGTATIVFLLLYMASDSAHRAIVLHESIDTRYAGFGNFALPLLEIKAIPAEVDWIGSKPVPSALIDRRSLAPGVTFSKSDVKNAEVNECLMLIGETADTFIVYDELHGSTVTFAKGDVVVELRTHVSFLPDTCPPRALSPQEIQSGATV